MPNFALVGVAGYIAPRHLKAIQDTGNRLLAAADPHDAVGVLDRFSFDVRFFPEIERFDICEKPLVINPWNLDALEALEGEYGRQVHTVLQLRVHPALLELKQRFAAPVAKKHEVVLTYITSRGAWYLTSWKGSEDKSGGLAVNIGIHFFDLLMWLFGKASRAELHLKDPRKMAGFLELERANVRWYLSVDRADLPFAAAPGGKTTFRSITIAGAEAEFSEGFTDLHTRVYQRTLAGEGFSIADARPSIELVYQIRTAPVAQNPETAHPLLAKLSGKRWDRWPTPSTPRPSSTIPARSARARRSGTLATCRRAPGSARAASWART